MVYSVPLRDLLRSFGITLDDFGKTTPAQESRASHARTRRMKDVLRNDFFENIQNQFEQLPLFLGGALPSLSGLARISLRDVFWLGGESNRLHPSLRGAHFVLVNRRSKKPRTFSRMPVWGQPLYLLQERDGSYLAGGCAMERGQLVLYAYPDRVSPKSNPSGAPWTPMLWDRSWVPRDSSFPRPESYAGEPVEFSPAEKLEQKGEHRVLPASAPCAPSST